MNLQSLLQEFNPSKFLVYLCLLIFTFVLALRLDGTISTSYWIVFTPLWFWKSMVIIGALIGTIVWARNPDYRQSDNSYIHFKSMLISLSLQLLLFMFELLVCDKLESERHLWILAFIPLIFISLLSIAICIWALKNDRGFEMELFCSVNILQFIFIALRLDQFIKWSWVVVFVPLWIVMCLAIIGVLYALIFAAILLRTPEVAVEQRKASIHSAISYSLVVVPLLIFLVLLSNKLDAHSGVSFMSVPHPSSPSSVALMPETGHAVHTGISGISISSHNQVNTSNSSHAADMSYFAVCIPLYFTFIILICLSFGSRGGNLWWFGMRKDFCTFLLSVCPCLREYGNISYNKHSNNNNGFSAQSDGDVSRSPPSVKTKKSEKFSSSLSKKAIVPHISIESPD